MGSVYIPRVEKDHHIFYFFSPPVFKDFLNATLFLSFYFIMKTAIYNYYLQSGKAIIIQTCLQVFYHLHKVFLQVP